jgi:hypothetical protein
MTFDELRKRYVSLFGLEPTEAAELDRMEAQLGVPLPQDFRKIAEFYNGGIIGGISHNTIATCGPSTNITDETKRLRQAIGLPHSFLVLAEPPESLIVMNTSRTSGSLGVIWCDAIDVSRLENLQGLHGPQNWTSYADFFSFLLDAEADERGG